MVGKTKTKIIGKNRGISNTSWASVVTKNVMNLLSQRPPPPPTLLMFPMYKRMSILSRSVQLQCRAPPRSPFHDWSLQYNQRQQGTVWSTFKHCKRFHSQSRRLKIRNQTVICVCFSELEEHFFN